MYSLAEAESGTKRAAHAHNAMAYTLGYFEGDYKAINNSTILADGRDKLWNRALENINHTGLYNGNISWMITDITKIGEVNNDRTKGMQAMLYKYDQLHRIKKSRSLTSYSATQGFATRTLDAKPYDEDYAYNADGGIITLKRQSETAALQDDFTYDYYENTHKLRKLTATGALYEYDAIGNLVKNNTEGVTIAWTPYGKVRTTQKGDSVTTSYRYDAAGNRIEEKVVRANATHITRYALDATGNIMAIYKDSVLQSQPLYGSTRLGEYRGSVKEGRRVLGHRTFELSNHLQNNLTTITDNVNMSSNNVWATVESATDYYPFGLEMKGRTFSSGAARFGFNGKEKDGNFGSATNYNYGFRIYDPRTATFNSVDPLTASYPWYTPYQFAGNKPIWAIDLDGLEELIQPLENREFLPVIKAPTKSDAASNALNNVLIFFPKVGVELVNEGIGLVNWSYGVVKGTSPNVTGVELVGKIEGGVKGEIKRVSKLSGGEALGELKEAATDWNTYKNMAKLYFITKLPVPKAKAPLIIQNEASLVEAGSIRNINKIGGDVNCVNCAIATDATLAGSPASALNSLKPQYLSVLEKEFKGTFQHGLSVDDIAKKVSNSGDRGIVFGNRGAGEVGHVFNVVNQKGVIRYLDGQTGKAADLNGYKNFSLLKTN